MKYTKVKQSCCSKGCREPIGVGELRVRSARDLTEQRWYHPGCVAGGLGPLEAVEGVGRLSDAERLILQNSCDDPALGRTRASFVASTRAAKRHRGSEATGAAPPPEDGLEEDLSEGAVASPEGLANMAWFDGLSYDALKDWVPTAGVVPVGATHAVARLKGAIFRDLLAAKAAGDQVGWQRGWKAITFLDRMLFAQHRGSGGERKGGKQTKDEVVTSRVRRARRGDWQALFVEAVGSSRRRGAAQEAGGSERALTADVRAVEAYVAEGLLAKAVARVKGGLQVATVAPLEALGALMPPGHSITGDGGDRQLEDPGNREQLVQAAAKAIRRYPRRSSPGPNGSRFEHWGVLTADHEALAAGAEVVVDFLVGSCPSEALEANLGARLLALGKPSGGIRPVAMGSVVRRLAARTACAFAKDRVAEAVGPWQYGVGRAAGCELVHKALTALVDEDRSRIVLAFDASNAFGTLPRQRVWDGVQARMPILSCVARAWLSRPTTHVWWDSRGIAHRLLASSGVDQGCPLSPLFFSLGLADALASIDRQLLELDGQARVFAYLDDVVVVVRPDKAEDACKVVSDTVAAHGLQLNAGKTCVWTADRSATLSQPLEALRKPELRVLGADVRFLDRRDDRGVFGAPLRGTVAGTSVASAARALIARLAALQKAGLRAKTAFTVLHTYAQGCCNHLLRANYEEGEWLDQLEGELQKGLEQVVGESISDTQRQLASLRLKEGGLAFGGLRLKAETAFLSSWALLLKEVAGVLGATSVETFSSRCPTVWGDIGRAERALRRVGGNDGKPLEWIGLLDEPAAKLQGVWGRELSEARRDSVLRSLPELDAADARSHGGPGAGPFSYRRSKGAQRCQTVTSTSPCEIACCSQFVRRAPIASTDALTGRCAMRRLTAEGGTRASAGSAEAWASDTIASATLGPVPGLAAQACRRCGSRGCPSGIAR